MTLNDKNKSLYDMFENNFISMYIVSGLISITM